MVIPSKETSYTHNCVTRLVLIVVVELCKLEVCCSHKQHHLTAGGHHGIANYNCNILISLTLPLQARPPGSVPAAMLAITSLAPSPIIMRATKCLGQQNELQQHTGRCPWQILLTVAVLMCRLASSMQCTRSSDSLDCVRYSVSIIVDTTQ